MSANLDGFIDQQRAAILAESALTGLLPMVALDSIEILRDKARVMMGITPPARLVSIGSPIRGWVQDTKAYKFFWAETENNYYRDDYLEFLNEHCGFSLNSIPDIYDIDHLFNRERARTVGLRWIRMFPVRRSPNRSHGAAYEKAATNNAAGRPGRNIRNMDELSLMKFLDIKSPGKSRHLSAIQKAHLTRMATLFGLRQDVLVQNVQQMLGRAYDG